jgi:hypothetical protein
VRQWLATPAGFFAIVALVAIVMSWGPSINARPPRRLDQSLCAVLRVRPRLRRPSYPPVRHDRHAGARAGRLGSPSSDGACRLTRCGCCHRGHRSSRWRFHAGESELGAVRRPGLAPLPDRYGLCRLYTAFLKLVADGRHHRAPARRARIRRAGMCSTPRRTGALS